MRVVHFERIFGKYSKEDFGVTFFAKGQIFFRPSTLIKEKKCRLFVYREIF